MPLLLAAICFAGHVEIFDLVFVARAAFPVFLQQPSYRFEQLPAEIGLTHGSVNCIKQDPRGVLWLGTWSGLVRCDGYKVRVFQQDAGRPEGLQSDWVTALIEDQEGNLWGMLSGIVCAARRPGCCPT